MKKPGAVQRPKTDAKGLLVISQLNEIMESTDFDRLGDRSIVELRTLRDRLNAVEAGLSFGRRMAQGRLDIVAAESAARRGGDPTAAAELMGSLPILLAGNSRSGGTPRAVRDVELPEFSEELVEATDAIVSPRDLSDLGRLSDERLSGIAEELSDYERTISLTRMNVHRIIDEVQEQIIARYRDGAASVDDLLK